MAAGIEFKIEGGPEWDRVEAALAETSATLGAKIRDDVTPIVDPWMAEAVANVSSTPIKGVGRQSGLRREVASSLTKQVGGSVDEFDVDVTSSLPAGTGEENEAIIPLGMDRLIGWRHPVFGHMNTWVQQVPLRHNWFSGSFDDRNDDVTNKIQAALDEARDNIAHAGR